MDQFERTIDPRLLHCQPEHLLDLQVSEYRSSLHEGNDQYTAQEHSEPQNRASQQLDLSDKHRTLSCGQFVPQQTFFYTQPLPLLQPINKDAFQQQHITQRENQGHVDRDRVVSSEPQAGLVELEFNAFSNGPPHNAGIFAQPTNYDQHGIYNAGPFDCVYETPDDGSAFNCDNHFAKLSHFPGVDEFGHEYFDVHQDPASRLTAASSSTGHSLRPEREVVGSEQVSKSVIRKLCGTALPTCDTVGLRLPGPGTIAISSWNPGLSSDNLTAVLRTLRSSPKPPDEPAFDICPGQEQQHLSQANFQIDGEPAPQSHDCIYVQRPATNFVFVTETGDGKQVRDHRQQSKGRRTKPLAAETRENARRSRQQRSTCIRCKKDRSMCDAEGSQPCSRCCFLGLTAKWQQPCIKADFMEIIETGICPYILRKAVNHLTVDKTRRVRVRLPEKLDLDNLLDCLDQCRSAFNIRVRQCSGLVYILNTEKCYHYLSELRQDQKRCDQCLDFDDVDASNIDAWHQCIEGCDLKEDITGYMHVWSNMPTRTSYSYVVHRKPWLPSHITEKAMNVEDEEDRDAIILAAQLSRLMCRRFEVDAYSELQRILNNWTLLTSSDVVKTVQQLGRLLVTLRWRISWLSIFGDEGMSLSPSEREAYEHRVHSLCRTLYFYFCSLRGKLPSWGSNEDLRGFHSKYPDSIKSVFHDFPGRPTIDGFKTWIDHGRRLIHEAGVMEKVISMTSV